MWNKDSSPEVSYCVFIGNTAPQGAGMNNYDGAWPKIDNCVFVGNDANNVGGGMYNRFSVLPEISNSLFCSNSPDQIGGSYTDGGGNSISAVCSDTDGDGTVDWADDDDDNDGILDPNDNCVFTPNPGQEDGDGDGIGDICDGVLYVDDDGPAPHATILAAINAAVSGDTIIVMEGTYVENINMSGKAITLRSTNPGDPSVVLATIIDGGLAGSVIICNSGEDPNTVIDGFLVRNGTGTLGPYSSYDGGGMYNYNGSSPTVSNCVFSGNSAYYGGGMYNLNNSSPEVINCTFSDNIADRSGGGMYNDMSSPVVSNCVFSNNKSVYEGMIFDGSAGGGMVNWESSTEIRNCTFIANSTVKTAFSSGGGVNNTYSSVTVTNCTFGWNISNRGGGMFNFDSSVTVSNCILWGNSALADNEISTYQGDTPVVSYSDIAGGYPGTGNINANPKFVDANGADDIIGTEDDNLRLSVGSPCIDAGDNSSVPADTADLDGDTNTTEPVPFDLEGRHRFFDDPCTADSGNGTPPVVDMGAYEYGSCLAVRGDFEGDDCDVDFADYAIFTEAWLTEPGDAQWNPNCDISIPADKFIDWNDLAVMVNNWLAGTE